MSNHEKFKETFEQIRISEDKLHAIENLEIQRRIRFVRKPAVVLVFAVFCVLMLLSGKLRLEHNIGFEIVTGKIIYYAAEEDGENEKDSAEDGRERLVLRKDHVVVNNDRLSDMVCDVYVDKNGLTYYELLDGSFSAILIEEPEHTSVFIYEIPYEEGGGTGGIVSFCGKLRRINDRIYLCFTSYEEGIDITDDFVDGTATGKIKWTSGSLEERVEETFEYRVEGTQENYTVDVWWVESE